MYKYIEIGFMNNKILNKIIIIFIILGVLIGYIYTPIIENSKLNDFGLSKILDNLVIIPLVYFVAWRIKENGFEKNWKYLIIKIFVVISVLESLFIFNSTAPIYNIIGHFIGSLITYIIVLVSQGKHLYKEN